MENNGSLVDPPATLGDVLARRTALVLWDLQNGLGGSAPGLPALAPVWERLRDSARDAGILILRSRHIAPPAGLMDPVERWRVSRRPHGETRPDHFMQPGSIETQFIEGFEPGPGEVVIEKGAPSLFHATRADAYLRAAEIETLVLAGVATEVGIDFTARHAMALGYFPVVAEDGIGSFTDEAHEHGLAILRSFTFTAPSVAITASWDKAQTRSN